MPGDTQGTVKITQSFQIVLCLHSYLTILKTSEIYLKMSAEKNLDLICARKIKMEHAVNRRKIRKSSNYTLVSLILSCTVLKNGQTHFKNFVVWIWQEISQDFLSMFGHFSTLSMKGFNQIFYLSRGTHWSKVLHRQGSS